MPEEGITHLTEWGAYMRGAKMMLYRLFTEGMADLCPHIPKKDGKSVYNKATFDWLMEAPQHIEIFLSGSGFYYTDFRKDEKGRLMFCKITEKAPKLNLKK